MCGYAWCPTDLGSSLALLFFLKSQIRLQIHYQGQVVTAEVKEFDKVKCRHLLCGGPAGSAAVWLDMYEDSGMILEKAAGMRQFT